MRARSLALVLAMLVTAGCGRDGVRAPPAAPAPLASPADAVPADLDLVIRIDVRRIRDSLGEALWGELRKRALSSTRAEGDSATESFLAEALGRADLAYIAVRPSLSAEALDNVLVLSGDFSGLTLDRLRGQPPWQPPVDLGGAWRRYERARPKQRAAPARIYAHGNEKLISVSEAEIDSVERALELGGRDAALRVPEQGVIAVAARLPAIVPRLFRTAPAFAELFQGSRELEASADLTATGLRVAMAMKFAEESQAERFRGDCARLLERLSGGTGLAAKIARVAELEVLGADVTLRVSLDRSAFGEVVACAAGAPCM